MMAMMAKERSEEAENAKVVRVRIKKKFKKKEGALMSRPEFCPNSSKSFHNHSRTVDNPRGISITNLMKNNDELAKERNSLKSCIANLKAERNAKDQEMMELREELAYVRRAQVDPGMVEEEVKKALSLVLDPLKTVLTKSLDNVASRLTEALTIGNNKGGQGRGSSTAASRQTDMRIGTPINRAPQSTRGWTIYHDPTTAAETTAQTSVPNEMSTTSNTEVGRSKFDLTNIGELDESRAEESVMDFSGLENSLAEESSSRNSLADDDTQEIFGENEPFPENSSDSFSESLFLQKPLACSTLSSLVNTSIETSPNPAVSPRVNAANPAVSPRVNAASCMNKLKAQSEDLQSKNKLLRRKSSPTPSPPVCRISVSSVKQPEETLKERDSRMSNEQPIPKPPKSPVSCRLPPPAPPFSCPPVVRNAILVPSKHDSSRLSRLPGTLLKDAAISNILRPEEEASQTPVQTSVSRTADGTLPTISKNNSTPAATDPGAPSLAADAKKTEEGSSKLPCDPLRSIVSEPLEKGLEVQQSDLFLLLQVSPPVSSSDNVKSVPSMSTGLSIISVPSPIPVSSSSSSDSSSYKSSSSRSTPPSDVSKGTTPSPDIAAVTANIKPDNGFSFGSVSKTSAISGLGDSNSSKLFSSTLPVSTVISIPVISKDSTSSTSSLSFGSSTITPEITSAKSSLSSLQKPTASSGISLVKDDPKESSTVPFGSATSKSSTPPESKTAVAPSVLGQAATVVSSASSASIFSSFGSKEGSPFESLPKATSSSDVVSSSVDTVSSSSKPSVFIATETAPVALTSDPKSAASSVFATPKTSSSSVFGTGSSASIFGSKSSVFGTSSSSESTEAKSVIGFTSTVASTTTPSSIFSTAATASVFEGSASSVTSVFGKASTSTTASSVFGSSVETKDSDELTDAECVDLEPRKEKGRGRSVKNSNAKRILGQHDCPVCGKSYRLKSTLKTHLVIHSTQKPFKCEDCKKEFNYKCNLMQHTKKCHSTITDNPTRGPLGPFKGNFSSFFLFSSFVFSSSDCQTEN